MWHMGDKTNKMLRCQGPLPVCLIQLVKTERRGEERSSAGKKMVGREACGGEEVGNCGMREEEISLTFLH
jgi:hypothetical protein